MNCLTRSLDLLHENGGWFAARASVHSEWGMHAIHIDRDGRVTSYVPPEPLLHPSLSLSGFDGDDRHADYPRNARPTPLKMIVVSAWILAIGATLWAIKRAIWRHT